MDRKDHQLDDIRGSASPTYHSVVFSSQRPRSIQPRHGNIRLSRRRIRRLTCLAGHPGNWNKSISPGGQSSDRPSHAQSRRVSQLENTLCRVGRNRLVLELSKHFVVCSDSISFYLTCPTVYDYDYILNLVYLFEQLCTKTCIE